MSDNDGQSCSAHSTILNITFQLFTQTQGHITGAGRSLVNLKTVYQLELVKEDADGKLVQIENVKSHVHILYILVGNAALDELLEVFNTTDSP